MALVLVEGFDHFDQPITAKYWIGSSFLGFQPGRVNWGANSRSIEVIFNNPIAKILPSTYNSVILGAAIQPNGTDMAIININGGNHGCAQVYIDYARRLQVRDSTGAIIGVGSTILPVSTFHYIELQIDMAAGSCELHLDGVSGEIPLTTGGDFDPGFGQIDEIQFLANNLGGSAFVDDVYVIDPATGSTNIDFLGDTVIQTLYPRADGTYTDWTPDTGSDHYPRVNEGQGDGDTSYVSTTNPTDKDTYLMDALAGGPVFGAQLNLMVRKNDGGPRQIQPLIRQGGVDYNGPTYTLAAGYVYNSWLLDQDPGGTDWSYSTVNADEFGIELVT